MRWSPGRQAVRSKPRHPGQWNNRPKDVQALALERDRTARGLGRQGPRALVSLQGPAEGKVRGESWRWEQRLG